MKMKKSMLSMLIAASMVSGLLAGCSGGGTAASEEVASSAEAGESVAESGMQKRLKAVGRKFPLPCPVFLQEREKTVKWSYGWKIRLG